MNMEVAKSLSAWVPSEIVILGFFAVTGVLVSILISLLKLIIMNKNTDVTENFKNLSSKVELLSDALLNFKIEFKESLMRMQYQMANMITSEHHHKAVDEMRNHIAEVKERLIKNERR